TAAFLSLLFTRMPQEIGERIGEAATADPEAAAQAQQLGRAGLDEITSDTTRILDFPLLVDPFREGFTASIDLVFLIAAGVVAIGFFVFLFLPQLALSEKSGIQAMQGEAGAGGQAPTDEGDAGEQAVQAAGAAA